MGTVKKLVLASLVTTMMVFTFAVGLFPTPAALNASAESGRGVDLLDFFTKALGLDKQVTGVTITFPLDGATVKVLSGSSSAWIPVHADVTPADAAALVAVGVDGQTNTAFEWTGTVLSGTVSEAPYVVALDLAALGANIYGEHDLYALAQTAKVTAVYETLDSIVINVDEVDSAIFDLNGDGLLDDPFVESGPGEIYVGTLEVEVSPGAFETKYIFIADLDISDPGKQEIEGALGTVTVPISASGLEVVVESASLADFVAASAIPAGEQGKLIVAVAPSIDALVGAAEAANAPLLPSALAFGSQFVEISIIYSTDGGVGTLFDELQALPATLPVRLAVANLTVAPGEPVGAGLWALSTDFDNGTVVTIPTGGEWAKRAGSTLDLFNASLEIYLDGLS
ncbi:MAG TPA: hypothetical protein QF901_07405, partial [Gammaproteobacteria bacterium]|nr:hypothetical protein [Gammaproteobacteria bacterium]